MLPLASTGLGVWWGVGLWGIEVTYCRVLLMHMRATGASAHSGTNESSRGCRSEKEGGEKNTKLFCLWILAAEEEQKERPCMWD